jgi:hypothetical protein
MDEYTEKNWLYLSEEIILKFLTNEKSETSISNFYRRILILNYTVEIDYKEVKKDNPIVKECIKDKKFSNRKKFFIVSKEAFEKMKLKGGFTKEKIISNTEKEIADRLAIELNGKREVCLKDGKKIDILTSTEIIEVKKFHRRLEAIGQILYYSTFYPKLKKVIHLFNHNEEVDYLYNEICKKCDITVRYEENL